MAKKTLAEKVFYKIWDIKNQRYITASREKSTWATLNGVQDKVRSMCQKDRYGWQTALQLTARPPEDFEIQMFHMVQFNRMNGREAYEAKEKKAQAEKERQRKIAAIKEEISTILPGIDFYRMREMLKLGVFNHDIHMKIEEKFDQIRELERPIK